MSKYDLPTMPFVEAAAKFGRQRPTAIILRGTMTSSDEGSALGIANAWHKSQGPWNSGHYAVDSDRRYRCVKDTEIAGTEQSNDKGAIRVAICAEPIDRARFWSLTYHDQVLRNTAKLVAELTLTHSIRPVYLSNQEREKWEKLKTKRRGGIIIDSPSGWPHEEFLHMLHVQRALKAHF